MTKKKKTGPLTVVGGLVVLVLAGLGYIQLGDKDAKSAESGNPPGAAAGAEAPQGAAPAARTATPASSGARAPAPTPRTQTPAAKSAPAPQPAAGQPAAAARTLVVRGPNGPTDLAPTLERIEKGIKHPHRNDGSVFQNREQRLPRKARGYYREYVHPTEGQRGPGPQRIVIGKSDEVYYTADHYETFRRVKWTFQRK